MGRRQPPRGDVRQGREHYFDRGPPRAETLDRLEDLYDRDRRKRLRKDRLITSLRKAILVAVFGV